ncbi:MAG: Na+/H+ antiporter NhaD type [Candidatus Gallionella acididurans]|uniref:Na+/H+ antiporter NhaD type n=1 Tax=Candidatus Gallionella acididurans TaxID=1796491 RepID=A0A139BRH8_9PROT|nr:MAG: Na+/H+ antiporter NhaD type [Candidatus Gallionella acididurans]
MKRLALIFTLLFIPLSADASEVVERINLTGNWVGIASVLLFFAAYLVVMTEEFTHLRKSKPVMLAAGIIWGLIAWYYQSHDIPHLVETALRHNLEEYAELMLFLLVAMTFVNAMEERNVFEALRSWLIRCGFGYRALFWVTGLLAFFISPVADNLTTALLMGAVVMAVGGGNKKFVMLACINIVVAANAGGTFSPFGDITTLMVWQKGIHATNGMVGFRVFFALFIPSLVNWLVPAVIMHFAVPNAKPKGGGEIVAMRRGALPIVALFLFTISLAVCFHSVLQLPPVIGMLTGLSLLQFFSYYLKIRGEKTHSSSENAENIGNIVPFDIFRKVSRAEWDTLFFFYGVVMCVGGLGFIGYLGMISQVIYGGLGATNANVAVGIISAVVDNIPVMFAVLSMMPDMSVGQWLLVTLTAGVGGSLLSIGSAAGVALMGQARGIYTFFGHLKWTPAIALGYAASIGVHIALNRHLF